MILPLLDASMEDKLMLFKINMPQCLPKTEAQRAQLMVETSGKAFSVVLARVTYRPPTESPIVVQM